MSPLLELAFTSTANKIDTSTVTLLQSVYFTVSPDFPQADVLSKVAISRWKVLDPQLVLFTELVLFTGRKRLSKVTDPTRFCRQISRDTVQHALMGT